MAFNEISNVTTFSGTDIEVIAYRDIKTPAQLFEIGAINRQLEELDNARSDLESQKKEIDRQVNRNLSSAQTLRQYNAGVPGRANFGASDSGKFQNEIQTGRNGALEAVCLSI